jgi:hypothetical protein
VACTIAPLSARRLAWILAGLALPALARASAEHPYDRHPPPTLFWMLAQAVPSPELGFGGDSVAAGMRWQLTPLLYSFGMNRKLSPWRTFVVEPLTRQSGSLELFLSPEYLDGRTDEWLLRAGVHATFPLVERGDTLALTIGAGACIGGETSAEVEAGLSVLYGAVGLFFAYAPRVTLAPATVALRLRWF